MLHPSDYRGHPIKIQINLLSFAFININTVPTRIKILKIFGFAKQDPGFLKVG